MPNKNTEREQIFAIGGTFARASKQSWIVDMSLELRFPTQVFGPHSPPHPGICAIPLLFSIWCICFGEFMEPRLGALSFSFASAMTLWVAPSMCPIWCEVLMHYLHAYFIWCVSRECEKTHKIIVWLIMAFVEFEVIANTHPNLSDASVRNGAVCVLTGKLWTRRLDWKFAFLPGPSM